jgi:hypothetical protein
VPREGTGRASSSFATEGSVAIIGIYCFNGLKGVYVFYGVNDFKGLNGYGGIWRG